MTTASEPHQDPALLPFLQLLADDLGRNPNALAEVPANEPERLRPVIDAAGEFDLEDPLAEDRSQ